MTRREFLAGTAAAAGVFYIAPRSWSQSSPNERLDIGVVGVGNRGGANLRGVSGENIVAMCDVDEATLAKAAEEIPGAKRHHDFRRLLDQKGLDAVVVSTPDHTHAVAAVGALKSGRDVYCEKPLARTVSEVRAIMEAARSNQRVTQLGTQIHAGENYRRVVEWVRSGVLGPVREVHVWVNSSYGNVPVPTEFPPVPDGLHYDLWLGPVEEVPYHPAWVPYHWRNWWMFGGGSLGDFGCHYMDLPHWALDLREPSFVEAEGPELHDRLTPPWLMVRYRYPAEGGALSLTWYHGGRQPERLTDQQKKDWKSGVLFVGEKGELLADYGRHQLLPVEQFADAAAPQDRIASSIGHHAEWIRACKERGETTCSFDYSGPLTVAALLGNVSFRAGTGFEWDTKEMKARGAQEAEQYVQHRYRQGWRL